MTYEEASEARSRVIPTSSLRQTRPTQRDTTKEPPERAFVSDYELVSGGTGFAIVEVADPVIQTNTTGVVLDADVRMVELRTRLRTLNKITGQDFGADVGKWRSWWQTSNQASGAKAN